MRYEILTAFRHLKATRQSFLSTITIISAIGVVLGVTALTAVVSVTGGFQRAYRERVLGVYPHIMLLPLSSQFDEYREVAEAVRRTPGVSSVSPFIRQPLMIYSETGRAMVLARGIDVDGVIETTDLDSYVLTGSMEDLRRDPEAPPSELPGVMVGSELARVLEVDVGTEVTFVSHLRGTGFALGPSRMAPTSARFRVVGTFEVGYSDFDGRLVLCDLAAIQHFINRGDVVTGLDVRVDDIFATRAIGREVTSRLTAGIYQALGWEEIHRNLFQSLKIQKIALSIVMTVIVIVACFNIVSTLVMMVLDKTREIAILKSMGATRGSIMEIFVYQGLVIGTIGTILGLLGGYVVCRIIENVNFGLDSSVYKISTLPVDMRFTEFVAIGLVSVIISFLATLYPSWRASTLSPVDGLRFQ
jgi:lipoprotein-releasing system permease protein